MGEIELRPAFAVMGAMCIALVACDPGGSAGPERAALTREELMHPEVCKDCHPRHYEQWSASMHAYAAKDPVFIAMNARSQDAASGQARAFCVNCHAPLAVRENAIVDYADLENVPEHLQGVTCYFCHSVTGVGPSHVNADLTLATDARMRGALRSPLEPSVHGVAYSPLHDPASAQSSALCGSCHDIVTPRGVRLERTYLEYQGSIVGTESSPGFQSCQDCHMKRVPERQPIATGTGRPGELTRARDLHEHLWPAVDVPLSDFPHADALRSAIEACELQGVLSSYFTVVRDPGPLGTLTVTLETQAGHAFPSGAVQDRRLWVELIAYDTADRELFRLGVVGDQELEESPESPHPCLFREYLLDENGHDTHLFLAAASIDDTRSRLLPPTPWGGSLSPGGHSRECTFRPPPSSAGSVPDHIDLRVRLRPIGMDVLLDLVESGHLSAAVPPRMPTFMVASYRAIRNRANGMYSIVDAAPGDCDTYRCLLDPDSLVCQRLGTGGVADSH